MRLYHLHFQQPAALDHINDQVFPMTSDSALRHTSTCMALKFFCSNQLTLSQGELKTNQAHYNPNCNRNLKLSTLKSMSPDASSDPVMSERISGVPSPPNSSVSKTIPIAIPAIEHLNGTPASCKAKHPPQTEAILKHHTT